MSDQTRTAFAHTLGGARGLFRIDIGGGPFPPSATKFAPFLRMQALLRSAAPPAIRARMKIPTATARIFRLPLVPISFYVLLAADRAHRPPASAF